jgi:acylphosphatase
MGQVKNFHIHIEGRVQGVGFRRFAQTKALTLDIKGWVRNKIDGRVEIKASAKEDSLRQFIDDLQKGPAFAKVREVKIVEIEEVLISTFQVLEDEEVS